MTADPFAGVLRTKRKLAGAVAACYPARMMKLVVGLALLAGVAAAVALVPLHGRTVLERWNAAPSARAFLDRGVREARASWGLGSDQRAKVDRPGSPAARAGRSQRLAARPDPGGPVEHHTEEDRAALDRIVAEHAQP